ncbi:hypothetical protein ABT186_02305 [Streptomyces sp. NPDC001634]|uniref:hypothetical protein n=1 Tax=Streptomyces sp. NPDC001634 TaxID=3154390 RepID=UPI00331EEE56
MRPARLELLLVDAINADGRLTARTYKEAGQTRSPYGIVATSRTGVPIDVQIVGRLADGERHDQPAQPVTGDPHPHLDAPDPAETGRVDLALFERYLASLAVSVAANETSSVALYQDRKEPGAVRYGATLSYHNGAAIFLYVLSAGSSRHEDFAPPATVNA